MTESLDWAAIAADIRNNLQSSVETLADADPRLTVATVLMSPAPASEICVSMKQDDCEQLGIGASDFELP